MPPPQFDIPRLGDLGGPRGSKMVAIETSFPHSYSTHYSCPVIELVEERAARPSVNPSDVDTMTIAALEAIASSSG